jgi:hypothetical protein
LGGGSGCRRIEEHAPGVVGGRPCRGAVQERSSVIALPEQVEIGRSEWILGENPGRSLIDRGVFRRQRRRPEALVSGPYGELEEREDERSADECRLSAPSIGSEASPRAL